MSDENEDSLAPGCRLVCAGCGAEILLAEPYPFRCPGAEAGDDVEHVLRRMLVPDRVTFSRKDEPHPFLRYRELFYSWHVAQAFGLSDRDYVDRVHDLDRRIAEVAGHGFAVTPFSDHPDLARNLGLEVDALWVKDETMNVSRTHKGRHLLAILIHLEVVDLLGWGSSTESGDRTLAIASCGNAALAAAILARAVDRTLEVFIPPGAPEKLVASLEELGATLVTCPREGDARGDPCYRAFEVRVQEGALPFSCQGPANALNLEGGRTLVYEIADTLGERRATLDRLFVQVGGGALASSSAQAIEDCRALGVWPGPRPRLHAVQTEGAAPLARAYHQVVTRICEQFPEAPGPDPEHAESRADFLRDEVPPRVIDAALGNAARNRSRTMRPWELEPRSIATAILDDETYDWLAIVRGMIQSGGYPIVVPEGVLEEAWSGARASTEIDVDPTGTAGLAGLVHLARSAPGSTAGERVGVLFTGVTR